MLPIAMIGGAAAYFICAKLPFPAQIRLGVLDAVSLVQPLLIFLMLFLTFCRVNVHDMRPCRWHLWLLLVQIASFVLLALATLFLPKTGSRVLVEAAMLCLICPTATAAAVVVRKLGGSAADVTTYTILINLSVALVVPLCVPMVHPQVGMTFWTSFLLIIGKVFPLLLFPFVGALLVRYLLPALHRKLIGYADLSFYLWAVALALAIAMTTRTIVHTDLSIGYQIGIAVVSLVCCAMQFLVGRKIGARYGEPITAGQALGQKNTVLAIWMGYMFFTPITSIAGGFYSVWHNLVNSYQLYEQRKAAEKEGKKQ